jgi:excisionase family DNA binding protein
MLTVGQVADRLGVKSALVYRLIGKGEIAHVRVGLGRGVIRVEESSVEEYKARRRRQAPALPEVRRATRKPNPVLKHLRVD